MVEFEEVKRGSKNTSTIVLQTMLRALQYTGKNNAPLIIDGDFGENSEYASCEFKKRQKAYGCHCEHNDCSTNGTFYKSCWYRITGVY